jgi:hypothetical protein
VSKADRKRLAGLLLGLAKASLLVGPQPLQVEFDDFGFDDGGAARLGELRDVLLRQQGWGAKYSERYLTDALLPVIGALRTTPDYKQALTAAEKLDRDWQEFTDVQHVYLPVENIEMTLLELPIGRARIKRVTPAARKQFEREIRGALASTKKTPEEIEEFVADQLRRLERLGPVVSIVEVNAEPRRAQEIAREETRRALDYLNYAASAIWGTPIRRAAGIGGDAFRGTRSVAVIKSDFTHYSSSHDFAEGVGPLVLNGATKKELKRLHYRKVSRILSLTMPNDLEEAIVQALHWYSDSWVQSSVENELLGLTTALEIFFTVRGQRIGMPLAEGVAFVLTTGLENRKQMVKRIKHLYGLRGEVTHGKKQQILPAEVSELRLYVLNLINTMIANPLKFDSRSDLREWIEHQRLS